MGYPALRERRASRFKQREGVSERARDLASKEGSSQEHCREVKREEGSASYRLVEAEVYELTEKSEDDDGQAT